MPFTEVDEESPRVTRAPRGAKRWLREIILEDWNLKLLALAITLGLWFAVTGQRTPATIRLRNVPLSFRLPNEMEISNEPRNQVEVTLTGSKSALDRINARDLVAYVDASYYKPGERVVQLTRDKVTMDLPEGVRIDDIEPRSVPLRLEPRIERQIEVEARIEGRLPEGYELRGVNISPNKVRVRGPESHVNALDKAPTETIPLEGLKESRNFPQTAVDIADQKVNVLDPVVNVHLEIGEQRIEKTLAGVTVSTGGSDAQEVRPKNVSVTVYGPRSIIEQLRAEELQVILEVGADGAIIPRLPLPPELETRVELRSINPSGFSIIK